MPDVVRRWHEVPSKYPDSARDTKLATACGAAAPSSVSVRSPALVVSVDVQSRPSAADAGGSVCSPDAEEAVPSPSPPASVPGAWVADSAHHTATPITTSATTTPTIDQVRWRFARSWAT